MASALPKDGGPVDRTEALKQLVAEVRLLVDHVSSRAGASLGDLKVENPRQPDAPSASATMTPADILLRLDQISERLDNEETQLMPSDFTFLQLTRDSLSRLIRPSSNLTVAYTTLVTQWGRTGKSPAKVGLATIAYPNLVRLAKWHRRSSIIFLFLAIGFTYLAVDLSVRVATGKYVLQTIDVLNGRRDALVSAKESLELSLNKTLGRVDGIPAMHF